MSFSRASIQNGIATTMRRDSEGMCPGTLVIGAHTFPVTKGPWENMPDFRQDRDQSIEVRKCYFAVRKALLSAAGVSIIPEATTATLCEEGGTPVEITIGKQNAPDTLDIAFRFEARAIAPTAPQT